VRRYGNSQGDGIAADRTACGAMGLNGAWLGQRGWTKTAGRVPSRGAKYSGIGREHGPEALEYYLETKGVVVATP